MVNGGGDRVLERRGLWDINVEELAWERLEERSFGCQCRDHSLTNFWHLSGLRGFSNDVDVLFMLLQYFYKGLWKLFIKKSRFCLFVLWYHLKCSSMFPLNPFPERTRYPILWNHYSNGCIPSWGARRFIWKVTRLHYSKTISRSMSRRVRGRYESSRSIDGGSPCPVRSVLEIVKLVEVPRGKRRVRKDRRRQTERTKDLPPPCRRFCRG